MNKVLIPTKLDPVAAKILTAIGNYEVVQDDSADLTTLAAQNADTYALIVRSEKVTPDIIDALPKLKVVIRAGAGYNTIDVKYARSKGIDVMNTPGANANAVAEEVIAMMLADARHIVTADPSTRAGKWEKKKFMGKEISGKTIGIVGLGNIGRLVAKRLSGFDVELLGYDPIISNERANDAGVRLIDLESLFAACDYITLHLPENDETRGMVNAELLSSLKSGATIVNCARAGIIDEDAMRAAKAEQNIRFLNDVYPKDAEGDKSVADFADLMLPHLGASTREANANAATRAAEQLIDLDEKGVSSYIVNRDIPEGLDEQYCELANLLARLCHQLVGKANKPKLLETSFYGSLADFADWLVVPIIAGLKENANSSMDEAAAREFLDEMGIDYVSRPTDASKGYGNSITIDLTSELDASNLRKISVRGTIAEGILMVARINEFNKLYFEPQGSTVLFLYDDRPGVLGTIGIKLAEADVNIEDTRNPHDQETNRSLAIMQVSHPVEQSVIDDISETIGAIAAFSIKL